jgi:hypothetical protein
MEFIKTFVELIPGLSDYPWWVKVLVFMTLLFVFVCIVTFIFVPKLEPVDNWRLASDESTLKAFVPGEWLREWETKKQTENDLTHKLQMQSSGFLLGDNPQPSSSLKLDVQRAQLARGMQQQIIEVHIHDMLAQGELIARGIPNEAPPHDTKPIKIQPAQWQYLLFSADGRALDSKGETVYKALEIGKAKGQNKTITNAAPA